MKQAAIDVLKQEAQQYAFHYYRDFIVHAKNNKISFEDHFRLLNFDDGFMENIIFKTPDLLDYVSDHKTHAFNETQDEKKAEYENERFIKRFTKEVRHHFKAQFAVFYLELMQDEVDDVKEDLQYAIEDEVYHEDRLYIGHEDVIGGPVSEEERDACIIEAKKKQTFFRAQLQFLKTIEGELKTAIDKKIKSVVVSQ